jgi:hypothetical protein
MNWYKIAKNIKLFRGEMANGGQQGHFFSPDKEFARNFTQSGRDREIRTISIDESTIYRKDPLPKAYGFDESEMDIAIQEALDNGLKAIWVDEGQRQPNSVFII